MLRVQLSRWKMKKMKKIQCLLISNRVAFKSYFGSFVILFELYTKGPNSDSAQVAQH